MSICRLLLFGQDPLQAVAGPRVHHQLLPDSVGAEHWTVNSTAGPSFMVPDAEVQVSHPAQLSVFMYLCLCLWYTAWGGVCRIEHAVAPKPAGRSVQQICSCWLCTIVLQAFCQVPLSSLTFANVLKRKELYFASKCCVPAAASDVTLAGAFVQSVCAHLGCWMSLCCTSTMQFGGAGAEGTWSSGKSRPLVCGYSGYSHRS